MTSIPLWFERTFDFSFPVEMLPNLCARLRGTPSRLEEIFRNQRATALTVRPENKWSAQENAGHLLNLESLWLARVEDYVRSSGQLTPTDLQNRQTDQANYNTLSPDQILHDFRAARALLLARIDQLDAALFSQSIPHPRLKTPMRLVDHLFFVAEHDDHHLARLWQLLPRP